MLENAIFSELSDTHSGNKSVLEILIIYTRYKSITGS